MRAVLPWVSILLACSGRIDSPSSTLAGVPALRLDPERQLPTVRIDPEAITPAKGQPVKLAGFRVPDERPDHTLLLPSLLEALRPSGDLGLAIHRDAPFGLVARVVYTARQAGTSRFDAVVETPEGRRVLPIAIRSACPVDSGGAGSCCLVPQVSMVGAGLEVRASLSWRSSCNDLGMTTDGRQLAVGCDEGAPPWAGRLVLPAAGACPSVAPKNGAVDVEGLAALLRRLQRHVRPCDKAIVAPEPGTTWADVAAVVATLRREGHGPPDLGIAGEVGSIDCGRGVVVP